MKLLRFLLFPFAVLYDLITSIRNFLFDKGILKSSSFDIPVLAVGNLSVGGTGKTPQIEYLINLLKNDYKIAVLSRGYKRKTKGFLLLNKSHNAEDVGDEPLQFFKKFTNVQIAVDADRTNGITQLLQQDNKPDIILLDDAFQHRKLKASFYILLTKYNDLFTDDFILPTGNLRESRRGAKRANIIVITKCPQNLSTEDRLEIVNKIGAKNKQKIFFTTISYQSFLSGNREILVNDLKNHEVLLVTGIANPKPMLEFLTSKEVNFKHLKFPDHHQFTQEDFVKIEQGFEKIQTEKKLILTTEKDFVRLENKLKNVCYLPIKTTFLKNENIFNNTILNHIRS